jgi:hypothetical protein
VQDVSEAGAQEIYQNVWGRDWEGAPAFITKNSKLTEDPAMKKITMVRVDSDFYNSNKMAVNAHELFGEAAIERGAIKLPEWITNLRGTEQYGILRDMAADSVVSKFIGKEALIQGGHDWWNLYPELMTQISKETIVAPWYNGLYTPYISGGLTIQSVGGG